MWDEKGIKNMDLWGRGPYIHIYIYIHTFFFCFFVGGGGGVGGGGLEIADGVS